MNLSEGRLAPVPGVDGLVTRTSGAVLFVASRTPAEEVARLTGMVTAADGPQPARALARELASLVAGDADGTLPGFALVADSAGGTYVRVYGDVEVRLSGPAGDEVLTGVGSFTGSDREVTGEIHTIAAVPAGAATPDLVAEVDVRGGTSLGNGFSLTTTAGAPSPIAVAPAAAPAPAPAPVAAPTPAPAEPVAEAAMAAAPVAEPEPAAPPVDEAAAVAAMSATTGAPDGLPPTEAAAPPPAQAPVEEQTQAWTPATADFERDDVDAAVAEAAPAAPPEEPAWGSPAPDAPALPVIPPSNAPDAPPVAAAPLPVIPPSNTPDAPSTYQPSPDLAKPPAEAPGTPTPVPESTPATAPPAAPQPVAWDDLPVEGTPPAHEPATVAVAPQPVSAATTPVGADPVGEFSSQLLGALDEDDAEEREPLPVETDPAEVRQPEQVTSEVRVQGVICSRGHFNDPRSRFCSSCGISMVQNTQVLTQGPRPPLGVMVFEDGATFSLSSDYVVGRQPEVSDLVQQGLALPLQVDDPERSISRAHAELRLVDWDVHLVNLSGTNGSFVWDESGQQWVPIPEGQSVVLTPGMRVALGRRSAVFESSLVR